MSTTLKTKIASVFVIAFLLTLLGPVVAFADTTDAVEPTEGSTIEKEAPAPAKDAEQPGVAVDTVVQGETTAPTTTEVTEPAKGEVKDETVTTPDVTTPQVTTPDVTTPQVTTPAATDQVQTQATVTPQTVVAGFCGDSSLVWRLDGNKLTIGSDTTYKAMWDFPYAGYVTYNTIWDTLEDSSNPDYSSLVTTIEFRTNVTHIGAYAFKNFTNLQTIIWNTTKLQSIGEGAFYGCSKLSAVAIPSTVTTLGKNAFADCTDLLQASLPKSLATVGEGVFHGCRNMSTVVYPGTASMWANVNVASGNEELLAGLQKEDSFTITFYLNDGSTTPYATKQTGVNNVVGGFPPKPEREGYTFKGWYTQKVGGTEVTESMVFDASSDVYAQWIQGAGRYTITFDPNGGIIDVPGNKPQLTTTDGFLIQLPNDPTMSGYNFGGWWTTKEGSDAYPVDTNFFFDSARTVYARWTPKAVVTYWVIKFNPNGGTLTGSSEMRTQANGQLASMPSNPTRQGYTFTGWYSTTDSIAQVSTMTVFSDDTEVFAQWTKNTDPDPVNPDKPDDPDPAKPTYKVIEGANGTWTTGSSAGLTARSDGDLAKFLNLLVDGKQLTRGAHYEVRAGSTIATLTPSYLNTLSAGSHTLTFRYNDGDATTNFTVAKSSTGDNTGGNTGDSGNKGDNTGDSGNKGGNTGADSKDDGNTSDPAKDENGSGTENAGNSGSDTADAGNGAQNGSESLVSAEAATGDSDASESPETGDASLMLLWALLMLAGFAGICSIRFTRLLARK